MTKQAGSRSAPVRRLERVAQQKLGFETLRAEQTEAIRGALAGRDTLCVMPTGSGKSAIYQIGDRALAMQDARMSAVQARLDVMRTYAETSGCRREALLRYFGEEAADRCDACDNCTSGRTERVAARMREGAPVLRAPREPHRRTTKPQPAMPAFAVDTRVHHREWGPGIVLGCGDGKVRVRFEGEGEKVLAIAAAVRHGFLEPVAPDGP